MCPIVVSTLFVAASHSILGCASTPGANQDMGVDRDESIRCYGVGAAALGGAGACSGPCWSAFRDPGIRHAQKADDLLKAPADHRAASQALRDAEAASCRGIADRDRDISPFAHRVDIASVQAMADGAVVTFAVVPGLTADSLRRIVDCHLARNAPLGHQVPEMSWCPLVPNQVAATVMTGADWRLAVTITSSDPDAAREIVRRAQALQAGQ